MNILESFDRKWAHKVSMETGSVSHERVIQVTVVIFLLLKCVYPKHLQYRLL